MKPVPTSKRNPTTQETADQIAKVRSLETDIARMKAMMVTQEKEFKSQVSGFGFQVQGSGFRVQGLGSRLFGRMGVGLTGSRV